MQTVTTIGLDIAKSVFRARTKRARHLGAQRLGKAHCYPHYELRVAKVERSYSRPEGRGSLDWPAGRHIADVQEKV
jgi:hypothetical protein